MNMSIGFNEICDTLINKSIELDRIPTINEIIPLLNSPSIYKVDKIFKENGFEGYMKFLLERGFKKTGKGRPYYITYIQLCELWDDYYKNNGYFPSATDCRNDKTLPDWRTVKKICGDSFNEFYGKYGNGKNVKTKDYSTYCELFKEICKKDRKILKVVDLVNNTHGLPCSQWFIKNCPDENVKDYDDFLVYLGFKPNNSIPKEYATLQIYKKYNQLNRPLKTTDFSIVKSDEIGLATIYRHWGTFNTMLRALKIPITQEAMMYRHKTFDEMKSDIDRLCNLILEKEGRKNISREDVDNCEWCLSSQSDDRCFKIQMNMNLCEYIKLIGFTPNTAGLGMVFKFEDGEVTTSKYEFDTSNFLRTNNIKYKRNVRYNTFVPTYSGMKDCDYLIQHNNTVWYVEVAGFIGNEKYTANLKEKIHMLETVNVNYKIIYPSDFREKSLEEIYSFINK